MMIGSGSLSPKYACFKCNERVFNSNMGACIENGNIFSVLMSKEIKPESYLYGILESDSSDQILSSKINIIEPKLDYIL